jgi:hypothetical protein
MPVRWMFIPMLMLACGWAQEPPKPRCNAQQRGRLWPEGAARSTCGQIEICTLSVWKYRWEPITVHVSQLAKDPKRRSACEAAQLSGAVPADRSRPQGRLEAR